MELSLWREHFARVPPGADLHLHQLVADIYCLLYAVFADPKAPKVSRIEVAPWLFPAKQVREVAEARELHRRHTEGRWMRRTYHAALEKLGVRLRGDD